MRDNEDPRDDGGPNDATRRLGTGMFLFYLFILFTNELYIYISVHWDNTGHRRPMQAKMTADTANEDQ